MWQSNRSASNSQNYYSGDGSSYNPNNHQSLTTQSEGFQPSHGASGWGQTAQNGPIASPATHGSSIGTSSHPFCSGGSSGYHNEHCNERNSVSNQGPSNVPYGQGSWHLDNSSPKALPSPVFQNELSRPEPSTWATHEGGSNSIYYGRGRGVTNNLYHNRNHRPKPPMEGHQPMQFSPWNERPNIARPPGRGCYPQNHRGGQGGNSVPNQGAGNVLQGQGSWDPDNPCLALPSPVFQSELLSRAPSTWPTHGGGSNSMHHGRGFTNNLYHNHARGPVPPMAGYQPMQFTSSNEIPPYIAVPPGRGSYPQNCVRGPMGRGRGGNHIGAGRGRGRNKMPRPAKSTGKSKEARHSHTHVCDPCERWFNSEEQLAQHISEHRTCGIDGCKLTAHTGVIEKHIKMQHDTGLYQKMKDMVNSDDFAKWRAERKLRYPSRENIVKRQEEQEEKIKRGESIGNQSTRFRGANYKRNLRRRGVDCFKGRVNHNPAVDEAQDNLDSNKFLDTHKEDTRIKPRLAINAKKPFSHSIEEEQIQDNLSHEDKAFSDTEWEPLTESGGKPAAGIPILSAALNTLAAIYDSDSDGNSETGSLKRVKIENINDDQRDESINEGEDLPIELPISRVALEKEAIKKEEKEAIKKEGKEDGDSPRYASNKRRNQQHQPTEGKSKQRKMNHRDKNTNVYKRKPDVSLLQKLLASEIRHERNVVLQCIRYIVENNFLTVTPLG